MPYNALQCSITIILANCNEIQMAVAVFQRERPIKEDTRESVTESFAVWITLFTLREMNQDPLQNP